MKIKPITSDEQWFQYIRRAMKTDRGVVAVGNMLWRGYGNWTGVLRSHGRKYKKQRLIKMIYTYYFGKPENERLKLLNKFFVLPEGK